MQPYADREKEEKVAGTFPDLKVSAAPATRSPRMRGEPGVKGTAGTFRALASLIWARIIDPRVMA